MPRRRHYSSATAMITTENYEKFMSDIQKQIDEADATTKQKADGILKAANDNYRNRVLTAIANARELEAKARQTGNVAEAERYRLAIEIYSSVLDSIK